MGDCFLTEQSPQSQNQSVEDSKKSFSGLFHEVEAYYLSIGMTYDEFWRGDPWLAKVYRDAQELRERRANVEAWRNGFYMASALSSTVGNMFRKKGQAPVKYMKRPLPLNEKEKEEQERQDQLERFERIKRYMMAISEESDS